MHRSPVATLAVFLLASIPLAPRAAAQESFPVPIRQSARAPVAGATSPAPPGPRLAPVWQSFEPAPFSGRGTAAGPAAPADRMHTIRVSTLVIVLAAVILVLLIV